MLSFSPVPRIAFPSLPRGGTFASLSFSSWSNACLPPFSRCYFELSELDSSEIMPLSLSSFERSSAALARPPSAIRRQTARRSFAYSLPARTQPDADSHSGNSSMRSVVSCRVATITPDDRSLGPYLRARRRDAWRRRGLCQSMTSLSFPHASSPLVYLFPRDRHYPDKIHCPGVN